MEKVLQKHRDGFSYGFTPLTQAGENTNDTGMDFGILKLKAGESFSETTSKETAYLHLEGTVEVQVAEKSYRNTRDSVFETSPFCIHVSENEKLSFTAETDVEIAISRTENDELFPVEVYTPESVKNEHRGDGQVDGACLRWVRTIFDGTNSHPNAKLVLGEVVNMPGKWSSYPPHHHHQPEIYHYRFSDPRGFGFAELGDNVHKVRPYDTIKILDNVDHAQCSAPGYAMYYIWVIRHLPENRYTVPEFTDDHAWTMDKEAEFWNPTREQLV
jgi:5-deoxy-glucuronate isomerase